MRSFLVTFGLIRTLFVSDYRSEGQRQQLERMGREFLQESVGTVSDKPLKSQSEAGLGPHPNAACRQFFPETSSVLSMVDGG